MKKMSLRPLVITAVAMAAMNAYADGASVYALIDGGIASSKISGGKSTTEFVTGGVAPNFVGFKLEKSMDGITAGVQLEQGFLLNKIDGRTSAFGYDYNDKTEVLNRQKNIYVKGSGGSVVFGMQPNIAFNTIFVGDPRGGSNYGSALQSVDNEGQLNTIDNGSISYASPSISGFSFGVQYLPQSSDVGYKSGSRVTASYSDGKFTGAVASYTSEYVDATKKNDTGTILAANYKMGDFTLKGLVVSQKNNTYTSALTTEGVGGSYALNGKTTIDAGIYTAKSDISNYKVNTTAIGAYYKLMKDLTLYGQYAVSDNKGSSTAHWNFMWKTLEGETFDAGQKASVLSAGLMYNY
jgi:hypothetical protein